jgi:hypothetical protein
MFAAFAPINVSPTSTSLAMSNISWLIASLIRWSVNHAVGRAAETALGAIRWL